MKINSTSSGGPLGGVTVVTRAEHGPGGGAETSGARNTVDLSPAARQLAALHDSSADVQAERVQQLRDALASGELRIDPARIADGLLASVRELLK